jgi:putative transposase
MARKPRVLLAGGIYHVTCRGNERGSIFKDDRDRERLLARLAESQELFQVRVYLYCLMSNHVHLLVETPLGNLDRFMGSVLTGYTVYYNLRHSRHGHLMQGRYGAQLVSGDEYVLRLSRYIHLNPVQTKAWRDRPNAERVRALRAYAWSSYREYIAHRTSSGWLVTTPMLGCMKRIGKPATSKAYARYVEMGLARSDDEFVQLMQSNPIAIGPELFVDEIKRQCLQLTGTRVKREDVALRSIKRWKSPEEVEKAVRSVLGEDKDLLTQRKHGAIARGFYAWALQRYAGLTQREAATRLDIGTGAGICLMMKRALATKDYARWRSSLELIFKG